LVKVIEEALPDTLDNRNKKAYQLVRPTLEAIFGSERQEWHTFKHGVTGKTYVGKGPEGRN
jgi:hypothetical protein